VPLIGEHIIIGEVGLHKQTFTSHKRNDNLRKDNYPQNLIYTFYIAKISAKSFQMHITINEFKNIYIIKIYRASTIKRIKNY